jgi:NTP pyrophosphatase (non-canonical NTP hydrolase)
MLIAFCIFILICSIANYQDRKLRDELTDEWVRNADKINARSPK